MKTILAAAVVAFAALPALAGVASAQSIFDNPLITTTCSFDQIDSAAHVEIPAVAAQLDATPGLRPELARVFSLPPGAARINAARTALLLHPQWVPVLQRALPAGGQLAATCHRFR